MTSALEMILGAAESAIGVGYKWGGNSLATGVDCSGLVQQAFRAAGINLPRVSNQQAQQGSAINSIENAAPGDLLFWDNSSRNSGADHVAIYIGNGMMLEAYSTGKPVRVTSVRSGASIRRVIGVVPQAAPAAVTLGPNQDRSYTTAAVTGSAAPAPTVTMAAATSTPPGGGLGDGLAPNASPEETERYIKEHFPALSAFMGDSEIHGLLVVAGREDWSDDKLLNAVHQTQYWKTHGQASRDFDVMLAESPQDAHALINRTKILVDQAYQRQGVHKTNDELGTIAKAYIRGGWTQQDLERSVANDLGKQLDKGTGLQPGESAAASQDIVAMARAQGLPLDDRTAQQWALDIAAGRLTMDGVKSSLAALAVGRWQSDPDVVKHIQAGGTAADYFAVHRNTIAQILELNPDSIDLFNDPRYRDITQIYDPVAKTKRSMTIGETINWARHQDAFKGTREYKQTTADTRSNLARFFGEEAA